MLFEVENDTDILEECVRPTLWITRGKLFNNLGYLTFITVVFVIWTRKRPPISLRSFNTRSMPSLTASLSNSSSRRTFCGKNRRPELEIEMTGSIWGAGYDMIGAGPWTAGSWTRLFLLLRTAFEAFFSEFRVFKVGSTVNWWWDRCGCGV